MSLPLYPEYKPSGVKWLGEVPGHWKVKSIKWLSPVQRGASPRPIDDPKYFDDEGEYAWVRIADVSASDGVLRETAQRLSELGCSLSVKIHPGELFISIAGTVGKPCISAIKACIHDGFVYFPTLKIPPIFLYRIFEAGVCYGGLGKFGTQLNLNTDTIGSIRIALPPDNELEEILVFLDRETGKIDALIAEQLRLVELLTEKRQAVISNAVTKGLNPNAPMKDSGIEWLGEVPEHWEVKRLKYVGKAIGGLTYDPSEIVEEGYGMLVLRSSNVQNGRIVFDDNVYVTTSIPEKIITQSGDILVCSRNGSRVLIGKNAMIDGQSSGVAFGAFMMVFRSEYSGYIFHVFNSQLFKFQSGAFLTATINQLTVGNLYSMEVPLPPVDEQHTITTYLNRENAQFDTLTAEANRAIALLQERRSALISAAVTGKIDVREPPNKALKIT